MDKKRIFLIGIITLLIFLQLDNGKKNYQYTLNCELREGEARAHASLSYDSMSCTHHDGTYCWLAPGTVISWACGSVGSWWNYGVDSITCDSNCEDITCTGTRGYSVTMDDTWPQGGAYLTIACVGWDVEWNFERTACDYADCWVSQWVFNYYDDPIKVECPIIQIGNDYCIGGSVYQTIQNWNCETINQQKEACNYGYCLNGNCICSDGTLKGECSSIKPKYCSNGDLISNCQVCGCQGTDVCLTDGYCIPSQYAICSDNTPYYQCSTTKPKYCNNGALVNNCQLCGCQGDNICLSDGFCVPPTYNYSYFINQKNNYLSGTNNLNTFITNANNWVSA